MQNAQDGVFGRNRAIEVLKRALRPNGIRIDLADVFAEGGKWKTLLSIYFERVVEPDSEKFWFSPKPEFGELVKDATLLEGFRLLLPEPPREIVISASEAAVPFQDAFYQTFDVPPSHMDADRVS